MAQNNKYVNAEGWHIAVDYEKAAELGERKLVELGMPAKLEVKGKSGKVYILERPEIDISEVDPVDATEANPKKMYLSIDRIYFLYEDDVWADENDVTLEELPFKRDDLYEVYASKYDVCLELKKSIEFEM